MHALHFHVPFLHVSVYTHNSHPGHIPPTLTGLYHVNNNFWYSEFIIFQLILAEKLEQSIYNSEKKREENFTKFCFNLMILTSISLSLLPHKFTKSHQSIPLDNGPWHHDGLSCLWSFLWPDITHPSLSPKMSFNTPDWSYLQGPGLFFCQSLACSQVHKFNTIKSIQVTINHTSGYSIYVGSKY